MKVTTALAKQWRNVAPPIGMEREKQFKDRVRGEQMASWRVGEARELGIYKLLRDACGHEVRWWQTYLRRARALLLIAQDKSRMINHLLSGPDLPADEIAKRRFFGEE